ncbi:ATP-binding protein [Clostridium botulinum C/D]|nr:ATP-binding protein [Clostridium botulinum C/D]MCD3230865.1 ATP-binding protein [Clostridium botulinum C/D]MCD3253949.1 ATP-binding protein [Clostridium botulinum C/D]MCD3279455.1 ATP-binding protein [Clostridium botulinum C/D]MCD3282774.1 ATP-binding protein [Clostridium botulinum C/D]
MKKVRNRNTTSTDHTKDQTFLKKKLISNKEVCSICKGVGMILNKENGAYKYCECVKREKMKRLWEKYGVDPKDIKKLNDFTVTNEIQKEVKGKAIKYIKEFSRIRNNKENGFALFGQPGAGKTHILLAIGAALISQGIEVMYMPYVEVMRELKATSMDNEYYLKFSSNYMKAKVLIIDDLFKDKLRNGQLVGDIKEADIKHLYPILNYRCLNSLPTLVSSECTPELLQILDKAQAGRILERCGDNITVFEGEKYNYRMRKFIS